MENTLISICIPAYMEVEFLERAINSCLGQSYKNIEIVITDDTPDDSIHNMIISKFGGDSRVRYFKNPGPHGAAANSNYAVKMARAEWIKFLYQDDEFFNKDSLQEFVSKAESADFIFSSCYQVKYDSRTIHSIKGRLYDKFKKNPVKALIKLGNVIGAPSVTMIKKNLYCPFSENMVWKFDLFFYIKVLTGGISFKYIEEPQISINEHQNQLTNVVCNDVEINYRESLEILKFLVADCRYSMYAYWKIILLKKAYYFPWFRI